MAAFWAIIALMMEAARTSETLVKFYQTTRCYNQEDHHLRPHRRENLKSYSYMYSSEFQLYGKYVGSVQYPNCNNAQSKLNLTVLSTECSPDEVLDMDHT
jgi:hypothetical protein